MTDDDTVREYFAPFLDLDARRFDSIIKSLAEAHMEIIDPKMSEISTVEGEIEEWKGSAARSFRENILSKVPGTVDNQELLVTELITAAAASREIVIKAQQDIITIAMGLEGALEALKGDCGCSKDELTKILGIIGAIAAAIAGVGAIIGAVGAAAAVPGVAASMAASAPKLSAIGSATGAVGAKFSLMGATGTAANNFNSTADEIALKGDTIEEVLESARKSIEALNKGMDDQEQKVKDALIEDTKMLKDLRMEVAAMDLPAKYIEPAV